MNSGAPEIFHTTRTILTGIHTADKQEHSLFVTSYRENQKLKYPENTTELNCVFKLIASHGKPRSNQ